MFTLKFQGSKDGSNATVCGVRFDTRYFYDVTDSQASQCHVTVFQKPTSDDVGTTFQVGGDHPLGYTVGYIENAAGKTIDRIGPFDSGKCVAGSSDDPVR